MSELDKLVSDIGHQVGLITNQLEEEKASLSELQNQFQSISKEARDRREAKRALEEEIKHLEDAHFRQIQNCDELEATTDALKKHNQYLETALAEIRKANDKLRLERSEFIIECRNKLKTFDEYFNGNEKLKKFVELWQSKTAASCRLTSLPDVIKQTARKLINYYENPVESTLIKAVELEEELTVGSAQISQEKNPPSDRVTVLDHGDERDTEMPQGGNIILANTSDFLMDSQLVDSSRLRMSALDTSIFPQIGNPNETIEQEESTMMTNITEPLGDVTSY